MNFLVRTISFIKSTFYRVTNPVCNRIIKDKLTYMDGGSMFNILQAVKEIERKRIPGLFIETGCALGGSAILIGLEKKSTRELRIYDVFGMIPSPTEKDGVDVLNRYETISAGKSIGIRGGKYYGYEEDLLSKVKENFAKYELSEKDNIKFVQGLYEETLRINQPVAFAHIDCDWYSSVMTCLKQIEPNLTKGGIIIIDDYYVWSGCKTATDDYFKDEIRKKYSFQKKNLRLILKKINDC